MFEIVEMPTGKPVTQFEQHEDALAFIEGIETFESYEALLETYGELRRVKQELAIMEINQLD
jgi:hypothetical protein